MLTLVREMKSLKFTRFLHLFQTIKFQIILNNSTQIFLEFFGGRNIFNKFRHLIAIKSLPPLAFRWRKLKMKNQSMRSFSKYLALLCDRRFYRGRKSEFTFLSAGSATCTHLQVCLLITCKKWKWKRVGVRESQRSIWIDFYPPAFVVAGIINFLALTFNSIQLLTVTTESAVGQFEITRSF